MRVRHILTENLENELIENIQKNCSEFISQKPKSEYLVKGRNSNEKWSLEKSKIRSKSSTNYEFTKNLHEIMQGNGFDATRLNSSFVYPTTDPDAEQDAAMFGEAYFVFPFNGFKVTYQHVGNDLGANFMVNIIDQILKLDLENKNLEMLINRYDLDFEKVRSWKEKINSEEFDFQNQDELKARVYWDLFGKYYGKNSLEEAFESTNEILIKASYFYYIRVDYFYITGLNEYF